MAKPSRASRLARVRRALAAKFARRPNRIEEILAISDKDAIASDWKAVSTDLRNSFERYAQNGSQQDTSSPSV